MPCVEPTTPTTTAHEDRRPSWISVDLVGETIATWQPYYADQLTERDAVAILQTFGRLFDVLEQPR